MNLEAIKTVKAIVKEDASRYAVSQPIYKEDYGLYFLVIEGLELPEVYTVDFSNSETTGKSVPMLGNSDGVLIPKQFIDTGKDIFAFLYITGDGFGRTVYKFKIPNRIRPDRTNEEPEPEEQSLIDQAINALNEAVEQTAQDVQTTTQKASEASESAQSASISERNASNSAEASVNAKNVAEECAEAASSAKNQAVASATSANQSANTATAKASEASASAETASAKADEARASATSASNDAGIASSAAESASEDAGRAERARDTAQGYASNAQLSATQASNSAGSANLSAQASAQSASQAQISARTASEKADSIHSMTASAQTLPDGSSATASYDAETGVMSFGIPKGKDGTNGTDGDDGYSPSASVTKSGKVATITITDKNGTTTAQLRDGEDGATGATPNLTIGTVETLEPTESATATITGTPENPVLNLGIPQGEQGEVTTEEFLKVFVTDTASGSIASFPDGADGIPLKSLVVNIDPVQDTSSGDPSPENICPISGWTGCNLYTNDGDEYVTNIPIKWDSTSSGKYIGANGAVGSSTNFHYTELLPIYTGSFKFTYYNPTRAIFSTRVHGYDAGGAWVRQLGYINDTQAVGTHEIDFDVADDIKFIKISQRDNTTDNVVTGQGSHIPINWQSEAGTVYGGKLDVLSGVMRVTHEKAVVSSFSGVFGQTTNGYAVYTTVGKYTHVVPSYEHRKMKSNVFTYSRTSRGNMPLLSYGGNDGAIQTQTYILPSTITSLAEANEWLSALETPLECTFYLATPIEIQLTPNQVNSLLGVNNIFADTGDTEVEYRADTKLYIEKLTQPEEDDMVADSAITSGQFFMVGNFLYRALTNIASGATITVGTNAERVSLADALNLVNA